VNVFRNKYLYLDCVVTFYAWTNVEHLSEMHALILLVKHDYLKYFVASEQVQYRLISFTNFNAQLLYSLTTCMLHYNPRHVSSINMPIFRRTNCIITASGIVTLPDESRLLCSLQLLMNKELCIKVGK
jgi:predicted P-loop ATPase/GTPase